MSIPAFFSMLFCKRRNLLYFIAAIFLQGCGQPPCHQGNTISSPAKKTIRLNSSKKPSTLDPRKMGDHVSASLGFMLFEGLTKMDQNSTHSFGLADAIAVNEEGTLYTFHIKKSFWSDGSLITAQDFASSWLQMLDPKFPSPSCELLYPILGAQKAKKGEIPLDQVGIKVVDTHLLEITLERPTPFFLDITSFAALSPTPKEMENNVDEIAHKNPSSFICNGPFRLKKYSPEQEIIVEKNPLYWDKDNVSLEEIHISLISDDTTALALYENGSIDLIGLGFSQIPKDAVCSLKERSDFFQKPLGATSLCQFNTRSFPFSNKNFRKAVAYAINRRAIVDHITLLDEKVATSLVPPLLKKGKEDSFFTDSAPTKAKEHLEIALKELGCTIEEIGEIPYLYTLSDVNSRIAQAVAEQLSTVLGIRVKPEGCEFKIFLDLLRRRQFLMSQTAWIAQYNDLMSFLERFKEATQPTNDPGWENSTYKELLEASYFCKTTDERMQLLHDAEALFLEEMPQAPLFHWNSAYLVKPHLKNLYISPNGSIHFTYASLEENNP